METKRILLLLHLVGVILVNNAATYAFSADSIPLFNPASVASSSANASGARRQQKDEEETKSVTIFPEETGPKKKIVPFKDLVKTDLELQTTIFQNHIWPFQTLLEPLVDDIVKYEKNVVGVIQEVLARGVDEGYFSQEFSKERQQVISKAQENVRAGYQLAHELTEQSHKLQQQGAVLAGQLAADWSKLAKSLRKHLKKYPDASKGIVYLEREEERQNFYLFRKEVKDTLDQYEMIQEAGLGYLQDKQFRAGLMDAQRREVTQRLAQLAYYTDLLATMKEYYLLGVEDSFELKSAFSSYLGTNTEKVDAVRQVLAKLDCEQRDSEEVAAIHETYIDRATNSFECLLNKEIYRNGPATERIQNMLDAVYKAFLPDNTSANYSAVHQAYRERLKVVLSSLRKDHQAVAGLLVQLAVDPSSLDQQHSLLDSYTGRSSETPVAKNARFCLENSSPMEPDAVSEWIKGAFKLTSKDPQPKPYRMTKEPLWSFGSNPRDIRKKFINGQDQVLKGEWSSKLLAGITNDSTKKKAQKLCHVLGGLTQLLVSTLNSLISTSDPLTRKQQLATAQNLISGLPALLLREVCLRRLREPESPGKGEYLVWMTEALAASHEKLGLPHATPLNNETSGSMYQSVLAIEQAALEAVRGLVRVDSQLGSYECSLTNHLKTMNYLAGTKEVSLRFLIIPTAENVHIMQQAVVDATARLANALTAPQALQACSDLQGLLEESNPWIKLGLKLEDNSLNKLFDSFRSKYQKQIGEFNTEYIMDYREKYTTAEEKFFKDGLTALYQLALDLKQLSKKLLGQPRAAPPSPGSTALQEEPPAPGWLPSSKRASVESAESVKSANSSGIGQSLSSINTLGSTEPADEPEPVRDSNKSGQQSVESESDSASEYLSCSTNDGKQPAPDSEQTMSNSDSTSDSPSTSSKAPCHQKTPPKSYVHTVPPQRQPLRIHNTAPTMV